MLEGSGEGLFLDFVMISIVLLSKRSLQTTNDEHCVTKVFFCHSLYLNIHNPSKLVLAIMSRARGIFPMALATVIGIGTGTVIFQPALKEEKEQKDQEQ